MDKYFQKFLESIYTNFKNDTSKMLIVTGGIGWVLSSAAQMFGILRNKDYSDKTKSFLLPQEAMDGIINLISFLGITLIVKNGLNKLIKTGKIAPESVRKHLMENPALRDKVGKLDLNLDEYIRINNPKDFPVDSYRTYKNVVTTLGTVGASIIGCNVVTPILRNKKAAKIQKAYIDLKQNQPYNNSGDMKI